MLLKKEKIMPNAINLIALVHTLQFKQREEGWRRKIEQAMATADQACAAADEKLAGERRQWSELIQKLDAQNNSLSIRLQELQLETGGSLTTAEQ